MNQLDLAEFLHERATKAARGETRTRLFREARAAYQASAQLDETIPETHLMYGRTFLEPGEDAAKAIAPIERAYRQLPAHEFAIVSLAEAYLANRREGDARAVLHRATLTGGHASSSSTVEESITDIHEERMKAVEEYENPDSE